MNDVACSNCLIAIAGPCGSGKTTIAKALVERDLRRKWIKEFEAPSEIRECAKVSPDVAESFQTAIIESRCRNVLNARQFPIVIQDRTFEEDREIFYPLYVKMGFLTNEQVLRLKALSHKAEALTGPPTQVVVLNAELDILKQRIIGSERPNWLIESINFQFDLYSEWIRKSRGRVIIRDVSRDDPSDVTEFMEKVIAVASP